MSADYQYDPTSDTLTIVHVDHADGWRMPLEDCETVRLADADVPLLADAIAYFDPSMLEGMDDSDSLKDWRIVFRSMFMRLEDACNAEDNLKEVCP